MRSSMQRSGAIALGAVALAVALAVGAGRAHADVDDQPWYERWYETSRTALGKALFAAAWPTAEYQGISYQGLTPARGGGVDLTLRVWGHSWLEGQIWTDVIISFRDRTISDLKFGRHSDVFFPPGTTLNAALQVLRDQLRGSESSPQPIWATVCIRNSASIAINYEIAWGDRSETRTLPAGSALIYRAPGGEQSFRVSLDITLGDDRYVGRTFAVPATMWRGEATTCEDSFTYRFTTSDGQIGLGAATWKPGSEHPFLAHVYETVKPTVWHCEQGYRWLYPDDNNDLRCVL